MQKRIKYSHTFLVFHRHIEMAFRTHKSFLLQPIGRSPVSASGVQLVETSLLGYHNEKYHIVSLLSKSIDHTMDTTSTRSCYNPSEKTMDFAEDYQGLSNVMSFISDNDTIINKSRSMSLIRLIFCSSIHNGIAINIAILSRRYS